MNDDKLLKIFQMVRDKTKEGTIPWTRVTDDDPSADGVYEYKTPQGYGIRIFPYTEWVGTGDAKPSLTLYDVEGAMIFDIHSDSGFASLDDLKELYSIIERAASGMDEKLDNIIADLDSLPITLS